MALICKDLGRIPLSLLDQGQNPENQKDLLHHWLSLNDQQVYYYVPKLDQTDLKLLRIQQLEKPQFPRQQNPNRLKFLQLQAWMV